MPTIKGTFAYTCIQTPVKMYKEEVKKEYKVSVIVDEDTADNWTEQFPKQPAKAIRTADFKDEFNIDPPFPNEKKQYVITLKRPAQYQDGQPLPEKMKPKVFLNVGNDENGNIVMEDITADKLVGNGSQGVASYEVTENDYGTFAKLRNIRVDSLIEYKSKVQDGDDDLGTVKKNTDSDLSGSSDDSTSKAKEDKPAKTKTRKSSQDEDDNSPF